MCVTPAISVDDVYGLLDFKKSCWSILLAREVATCCWAQHYRHGSDVADFLLKAWKDVFAEFVFNTALVIDYLEV